MDGAPLDDAGPLDLALVSGDDRVYLVPYRWWKESQEPESESNGLNVTRGILYIASPNPSLYGGPMRLINNIFNSDLAFNLRRDDGSTKDDAVEGDLGRTYALVPNDMWSQALIWHNETINGESIFAEDEDVDVYHLKLRIAVIRETSRMTVKISKKDNAVESYKRACKIFSVDSEVVRIFDFSGRTNLILMNDWNRLSGDGQRISDQEILLEVQVYTPLECLTCRADDRKDELVGQHSKACYGGLVLANGCTRQAEYDIRFGISKGYSSFGLIGLENLGNTCFMNSAIQCLAHTQRLVEYFIGDYSGEINHQNPLGMGGELAIAFGELLRKLWAHDKIPVAPRVFKAKLARFAPQFSGFNQHDSQELLAFLLDGLHEDLNHVKCKPYVEAKDSDGRPDQEVANEYWENHLARNDSIIVDICQGQYRSTLVCPVCNKVSVTFDPFMYLSLPLPSSTTRPMTVTVFSTDGTAQPASYTVNVPKLGRCKDLTHALSSACSLRNDEFLLVVEVYANRIIRWLEDPSDELTLIRDGDTLAAYRLLKVNEELPLVVFTHQREQRYTNSVLPPIWKVFGVPLIGRLFGAPTEHTMCSLYLKLLNPFLCSPDNASCVDLENGSNFLDEVVDVETDLSSGEGISDAGGAGRNGRIFKFDFQFHLTNDKGHNLLSKIEMNEAASLIGSSKQVHVLACWQGKTIEDYDIPLLSSLPEIYKSSLFSRRPLEPASLYACLESFLKEEPLGPEDMWYCPSCKKHQQASKKLDLWRLPEVLVIHLKRFSYNRYIKNKLETLVDFPIHDLDLSNYVSYKKTKETSNLYGLYAISNHYGNMGGGHYTAYVYHEAEDRWYDFDDRHVYPVSGDSIKTSAAYVLFYKRVQKSSSSSSSDSQSTP